MPELTDQGIPSGPAVDQLLADRSDATSLGLVHEVNLGAVFGTPATVAMLVLADALTIVVVTAFTVLLRRELLPVLPGIDTFAPVRNYVTLWPALVLLLLGRSAVGLYPGHGLHPAEDLRRQTWVTIGLGIAVLAGGALFTFSTDYSRLVLVLTALMLLVALPLSRSVTRNALAITGRFGTPVWILGASAKARELAELLKAQPEMGLRPIGMSITVPGPELRCRRCLVVSDGLGDQPIAEVLDRVNDRFERVWLVPDLLDVASVWVTPRDIQGHLALELRNNLLERRNQIAKRGLDLVLCGLVLPLALALGLIVAVAVRGSGSGPVVLRQSRVGAGGKQFGFLKFRTMHADAAQRLEELLASDAGAKDEWLRTRKLASDPRVTRVGRFLRRTSLDELPQLLNVILGQMSLVGPRPVMPDEVEWYGDRALLLHRVKPGMTGLTQISGRSTLTYSSRVRLDTYYIRNWSIWLDLVLLGKTLGSVLRGTGAF